MEAKFVIMNNVPKVIEWLKKMGYDGEIPETLNQYIFIKVNCSKFLSSFFRICMNSTSIIWDQLIQNTKPRQEVDTIRKNVIINRLKMRTLNQQVC